MAEIAHGLGFGLKPVAPVGAAFAGLVRGHYEAALSFYGEALGARVIRKHLGWYMDRAGTPSALRKTLLTGTPAVVRAHLEEALAGEVLAA